MNRKVKHKLAWELVTVPKTDFFPQMKTSRKVHICLHWFFYSPDNVLLCKAMLVRCQWFITYVLLLVNAMFA